MTSITINRTDLHSYFPNKVSKIIESGDVITYDTELVRVETIVHTDKDQLIKLEIPGHATDKLAITNIRIASDSGDVTNAALSYRNNSSSSLDEIIVMNPSVTGDNSFGPFVIPNLTWNTFYINLTHTKPVTLQYDVVRIKAVLFRGERLSPSFMENLTGHSVIKTKEDALNGKQLFSAGKTRLLLSLNKPMKRLRFFSSWPLSSLKFFVNSEEVASFRQTADYYEIRFDPFLNAGCIDDLYLEITSATSGAIWCSASTLDVIEINRMAGFIIIYE